MHDVVVVGAGPTGCYAARELARLGYEVLVLEEHTEIGEPVHCTGIVGIEACRRFDIDPSCIETHLSAARFYSAAGQSFRVASEEAQAVVIDRSRFDRVLGEQALSLGASFLLGARVEGVATSADHVSISAAVLGEPLRLRSALVVLATGADDAVTRQLGLAHHSGPTISGAQLVAETGSLDEVEVHLGRSIAPNGFAWAVPANGHGCRVGLVCQGRPRPLLRRFAASLERRGAIRRNGARVRCRAVPSGPRRPSFGDRVLVIGDAAGQVKATTCGGIYYGLLGAEAAVSAAHSALTSGDLSIQSLSRYEHQWLARLGAEQRTGRLLRRLHEALTDRDMEALFWLASHTGLPRLLSRLRFDWHTSGMLALLWQHVSQKACSREPATRGLAAAAARVACSVAGQPVGDTS
ncbi:MAG: NAD(P)/FAD-dependent oxidoreductase [Armatimonadota bacterium]